jgi:hypothetical protein
MLPGPKISASAQIMNAKRYPKDVRILQGQYDYRELMEWNDRTLKVRSLPGVSSHAINDAEKAPADRVVATRASVTSGEENAG